MAIAKNGEKPKEAASVILVRDGDNGAEVYLLRRHRKAGYMASSYVFPGGVCDEGDCDLRRTAARELFEESGVLLTDEHCTSLQLRQWRDIVNGAATSQSQPSMSEFQTIISSLPIAVDRLHYFSHWITPSIELRRYSAKFYVAILPKGQVASPDHRETVDDIWLTPHQALMRAAELRLPPPQMRTCFELLEPAKQGAHGIVVAAATRSKTPHPIVPRAYSVGESGEGEGNAHKTLLLPWDTDYEQGSGAGWPIPQDHPLAWGPSRFVFHNGWWNYVPTPDS